MVAWRSDRLIGRGEELARLRRAVQDARGGTARTVVVEGEPGIGKTRLATELLEELRQAGDLVAGGHGVQLVGEEMAYGVAAEMLRDLVAQLGARAVIEAAGGHAPRLALLHPDLAGAGVRTPSYLDRAALFSAMHALLLSLSVDRVVCLFVDDLQWVDASSRDLFGFLARASAFARVLLLSTVRSAPADYDPVADSLVSMSRGPGAETITLAALRPEEVADQVASMLGPQATDEVVSRVQLLSEGIPLYVESLLAAGDGVSTVLRASLAARLEGLSDETLRYLRSAAVGAGHALEDLVAEVSGLDRVTAARARREATARGLLDAEPSSEVRFHHALLRDAVLEGLLSPEVDELHRAWAHQLEHDPSALPVTELPLLLASHWYASGDRKQALSSSIHAARAARHRGADSEAAVWWDRALSLWDRVDDPTSLTGVTRDDVLVQTIRNHIGQGTETALGHVLELCRAELAAPHGHDWVRDLYLRLLAAWVPLDRGTSEEPVAPDVLETTATRLLAEPGSLLSLECTSRFLLRYMDALAGPLVDLLFTSIDRTARVVGDQRDLVSGLVWQGRLHLSRGDAQSAVSLVREAIALTDTGAPPTPYALGHVILVLTTAGEVAEAVAVTDALVDLRPGHSAVQLWSSALSMLAWALYFMGDWERSWRLSCDLLDCDLEPVDARVSHALMTQIAALRGDLPTAREHQRQLQGLLTDHPAPKMVLLWQLAMSAARVSLEEGDADEAWRHLSTVLLAPDFEYEPELVYEALLVAAQCLRLRDAPPRSDVDEVRLASRRLVRIGRLGLAWSAEVEAQLDELDARATSNQWNEVVDAWDRVGYAHYAARARLSLAQSLVRDGDPARAAQVIADALDAAERMGAQPLTEALHALARSGRLKLPGERRPSAPPGLGRLTAREVEVLSLVAVGKTNNQIATDLFMSPKTASVHVSRIITKLGLANRTEAAAYAHRHGLLDS